MPPPQTALRAVQKFRLSEFKDFPKHLRRFGPLPETSVVPPSPTPTSTQAAAIPPIRLPNPFIPWKNPATGRWVNPKYSLRRQADLVKKAKASGMVHLLPPGPKLKPSVLAAEIAKVGPSFEVPQVQRKKSEMSNDLWAVSTNWSGEVKVKEVAGSDIGVRLYAGKKRMFKGHKWERVHADREKKRKILMRDMSKRIRGFKNYYKRRTPNPLKPSRSPKAPKLPF
ncbi:hypothetical protein BDQ12DRAFT_693164 [Crucibulum laeve]|uniref:Large ribosomal subunit protein mL59 domain-containing protein n=1 Tax=Crucibulum laeve TaxID=68775 RepID=A0A5C3LGX8_9AGAR|nr:hypothetical protein BDQ12DRAFT_693164 [Crucibulum laeve]